MQLTAFYKDIIMSVKTNNPGGMNHIMGHALAASLGKLSPRDQARNFVMRGFKFKVQHPVLGYWRLLKKLHRVS